MRTTADPRALFREIDATLEGIGDTYEFNVASYVGRASMVKEGEEVPQMVDTDYHTIEVEFVEYDDDENERLSALTEVQENTIEHSADNSVENDYTHTTLFTDRENDDTYLVDTSRFGYKVVKEYDDSGEMSRGAYVVIFPEAGLKIR